MIIEPKDAIRLDAAILKKIVLKFSDFTALSFFDFSKTADPENLKSEYEERLKNGSLLSVSIDFEGKKVGVAFVSFIKILEKKLLFIENIYIKNTGEKIYENTIFEFERIAKSEKCFGILAETQRPACAKKMFELGFNPYVIKLIKKI